MIVICNDGQTFKNINFEIFKNESAFFDGLFETCEVKTDEEINISNVSGKIFEKILEYYTQLAKEIDLITFESKFFESIDDDTLLHLINATDFLGMDKLLEICCKTIANYIKQCKSTDELEKRFSKK